MRERDVRELAAFGAVVVLAAVAMWLLRPTPDGVVLRVPIDFPVAASPHEVAPDFSLAPDGSAIVYRTGGRDDPHLRWRSLDSLSGRALPGTEGARSPAISRDGRIAFVATTGDLRALAVATGASSTLGRAPGARGLRWSPDDDWLYFTDDAGAISRLPGEGGAAERVTAPAPGERHLSPEPLASGDRLLYTTVTPGGADPTLVLHDLESGTSRAIWAGRTARHVRSGVLVFLHAVEPVLLSAPFDPERDQRPGGPPVRIADRVASAEGVPLVDVSSDGSIVFATPLDGSLVTPVWVDTTGAVEPVDSAWVHRGLPIWSSVEFDPDGRSVAVSAPDDDGAWHLWLVPLDAGWRGRRQATHEGRLNYRPRWTPDGAWLTFLSDRSGQSDLWRIEGDGAGPATLVLDQPQVIRNGAYTPDGARIVFREGEAPVADIHALPVDPEGRAMPVALTPLVATEAGERSPVVSPDGRWLAFTSDVRGRWDVYVRPLDGAGSPVHVSPLGGEEPVWAPSGGVLYFRTLSDDLAAVSLPLPADGRTAAPRTLFSTAPYLSSDGRAQYAVAPDGTRFLFLLRIEGGALGWVRLTGAVGMPR